MKIIWYSKVNDLHFFEVSSGIIQLSVDINGKSDEQVVQDIKNSSNVHTIFSSPLNDDQLLDLAKSMKEARTR